MASSAMTGERRWVTARRGGMTVLGKIAVPKPINLPSQKLENHGLDPNVEIVPRGTIGWGNAARSPPSVNTLGSSPVLSPRTEGNTSSPSHLSGRPSSGGGGTRPSTAGSEKPLEPAHSAWSSSRPSSASGGLAGNTTLITTRPRSADTRPSSSQLSRFAESSTECSVAWRGQGTSERMGAAHSKTNEFMLASGDFPTLGSDKSSDLHGQQGHNTHVRPSSSSSSSRPSSQKGRLIEQTKDAISDKGTVNTWKRDDTSCQGGEFASPEKWQRDTQHPIPYTNMPPQHFHPALYAAPIPSQPEGRWYRGEPVAPYGPLGGHGGRPLDHSDYYPQMPLRPASYRQTVLGPGTGATGYPRNGAGHPGNFECQHPLVPNSYMFPGYPLIPGSPGMYPASLPYGGYCGPMSGFRKNDETDAPVMATTGGAPAAKEYRHNGQSASPDPSNPNTRPMEPNELHVPTSHRHKEQAHDNQGPYKVLLKFRDEMPERVSKDRRGQHVKVHNQHSGRPASQASSVGENDWDVVASVDEPMDLTKPAFAEDSLGTWRDHLAVAHACDSSKPPVNDHLTKKAAVWNQSSSNNQHHAVSKTSGVSIGKATREGGKSGVFDGYVGIQCSSKENSVEQSKLATAKGDCSTGNLSADKTSNKGKIVPNDSREAFCKVKTSNFPGNEPTEKGTLNMEASALGKYDSSETVGNPQGCGRGHVPNRRGDYHTKGKFNMHEGDGWKRKVVGSMASTVEASSEVYLQEHGASQAEHEKPENVPIKAESSALEAGGESYVISSTNSGDHKTQCAKMREIAAQRAKQRQEEEEERLREQKAKALAKLEELNRRTTESSTLKIDETSREGDILKHKAVFTATHEPTRTDSGKNEKIEIHENANMEKSAVLNAQPLAQISSDPNVRQKSVVYVSKEVHSDTSNFGQGSQPHDSLAVPKSSESCFPEPAVQGNVWRTHENVGSNKRPVDAKMKQKPMPYKRVEGQSILGGSRNDIQGISMADESASDNQCSITDTKSVGDGTFPLKRKGNKGFRSKQKPDQAPTVSDLTTSVVGGVGATDPTSQVSKHHVSDSQQAVIGSVQPQETKYISKGVESKEVSEVVTSETQIISHASNETHARVTHWRNQPSRRPSRGTHVDSILSTVETVPATMPASQTSEFHVSVSLQKVGSLQKQEVKSILEGAEAKDVSAVPTFEIQNLSHASDEAHDRVAHWRNQSGRRPSRGTHVVKQGEKLLGNETIWAPVHTSNQNLAPEEPNSEDVRSGKRELSSQNVHIDTQSSFKSKRAEMERYVPKPVAKELQHGVPQGSSAPNPVSDLSTTKTDATQDIQRSERNEHIAAKTRERTEITTSENKHKHGKSHTSWRQQTSGETYSSFPSSQGHHTSAQGKDIPDAADIHHACKPRESFRTKPEKHSGNRVENSSESKFHSRSGPVPDSGLPNQQVEFASMATKDKGEDLQLAQGGDYNHTSRRPKFVGSDGKDDFASSFPIGSEHKPSQWQPKPHPHNKGNKISSIGLGGENSSAQVTWIHGKQFQDQESGDFSHQVDKDPGSQTKTHQSPFDAENARARVHSYHQERERERKGPVWRHNRFSGELGPQQTSRQASLEQNSIVSKARVEQPVKSSYRRHGRHGSGFHDTASGEPSDGNNWDEGQGVSEDLTSVSPHSEKKRFENGRGGSQKPDDSFQQNPAEIFHQDGGSETSVGSKFRHNQGRRGGRFYGRASHHIVKVADMADGK